MASSSPTSPDSESGSLISKIQLFSYQSIPFLHLHTLGFVFLLAITLPSYYFLTRWTFLGLVIILVIDVLLYLLSWLCCYWSYSFRIRCMFSPVGVLEFSKLVRSAGRIGSRKKMKQLNYFVRVWPIEHRGLEDMTRVEWDGLLTVLYFVYQKRNYYFEFSEGIELGSENPSLLDFCHPAESLLDLHGVRWFQDQVHSRGLSNPKEISSLRMRYGENKFDIPLPSFLDLYKQSMLKPFFIFQIFCVALWCLDEYWYYSVFTLVMLFVFEGFVVKQRLGNLTLVRRMRKKPFKMAVWRSGKWDESLFSDRVVPGDIVSISEGKFAPCDLVVLGGKCVVDESLLTGESAPQVKIPIVKYERVDGPAREIVVGDDEQPRKRTGASAAVDREENDDRDEMLELKTNRFKPFVVFGGTKVLKTISGPRRKANSQKGRGNRLLSPPGGGCPAVVLRTGFETNQGNLLRTILFSTQELSANNFEALIFILFLLVFAILASSYVLYHGLHDPDRSRYQLFLKCVLILTSVVPPELPMELAMAVNSSLLALTKLGVFCTEPFRIPSAGTIDVCCFDKTGTLTAEKTSLKRLSSCREASQAATLILASCHSLVFLGRDVVGDPLEKAAIEFTEYSYSKNSAKRPGWPTVRIRKRFPFSSDLKRMSVVASIARKPRVYLKGAAEVVLPLLREEPRGFLDTYHKLSASGDRVLALASRQLHAEDIPEGGIERFRRVDAERDLVFEGFAVFETKLKKHTKSTIQELLESNHRVVMITGDNPFTACNVARSIELVKAPMAILHVGEDDDMEDDVWKTVATGEVIDEDLDQYELCVTGTILRLRDSQWLEQWARRIVVYARTTPSQKEDIVMTYKKLGMGTLMCGDGTNDVGGLKQSDCGIALLAKWKKKEKKKKKKKGKKKAADDDDDPDFADPEVQVKIASMGILERCLYHYRLAAKRRAQGKPMDMDSMRKSMAGAQAGGLGAMDNEQTIVQLGDASIAAPFTSRLSTIQSVRHVISQGVCTLVTTMQMYKILALNCLLSAYSLSVLSLMGVKLGDKQMLLEGMGIALCFFFVSRAKPLPKLSTQKPHSSIFAAPMVLSMLGQFLIHLIIMVLCSHAARISIPLTDSQRDIDAEYEMNLLNSVVFVIETLQNIVTFLVNYEGKPFMQSVFQNYGLFFALLGVLGVCFIAALGVIPEFNEYLEMMVIPESFRPFLMAMMVCDVVCVIGFERLVKMFFRKEKKGVDE